jgi:hypothetical protein
VNGFAGAEIQTAAFSGTPTASRRWPPRQGFVSVHLGDTHTGNRCACMCACAPWTSAAENEISRRSDTMARHRPSPKLSAATLNWWCS